MPFIQLTGGAYQSRSLIAAAQRCLNLYPEVTPQEEGESIRVTHFCTPGLTLQSAAPVSPFDNGCRGMYTASNGDLYICYDQSIFHYSSAGIWTNLGSFVPSAPSDATARDGPVSMADNGFVLIVVDGSVDGYFIDLTLPIASQRVHTINRTLNTGWYGADNISFQDTFFLMNQPGTTKWYISLSNITASNLTALYSVYTATIAATGAAYSVGDVLTLTGTGGAQVTVNSVNTSGQITGYGVTNGGATNSQPGNPVGVTGGTGNGATFTLTYQTNTGGFDPLDFVGMEAQVTECVAAVSAHRVVWVLGTTAYEIWVNSGGTGTSAGSFPFTIYPVGFANFGVAAKNSVATIMNKIFWVSQDKYGHGMVMMGDALTARRISTHAIEFELSRYPTIDDAVAYTYQQMGHSFVVFSFSSANNDRGATWVYDETTNEWHERCYIDSNGIEYRHWGAAAAAAYGQVFVGDWRNGNLYTFDLDNYTDNGSPIKRLRSFPHQIDLEANRRVMYHQLIAQMQVGSRAQQTSGSLLDCQFDAPDNTLLQNYSNINSFGAGFTKVLPVNAVIVNDAVVAQTNGSVLYRVAGTPSTPDYTIHYKIQPTQYNQVAQPGDIEIIGRATDQYLGYAGTISSDGQQYFASLSVGTNPVATLPMGTLSSSYYQIILTMVGTAITLQVYRNYDGSWLSSDGHWVASPAFAVQITDDTFTEPGMILIAGDWGGSGPSVNVGIEGVEAVATLGGSLTVSANNPGLHGVSGASGVGILTVDVH